MNGIPDIINQSVSNKFTQISNDLLRDINLSLKATGLICLLLSNKKGWHSYIETIKNMKKDGETSIRSAIKELEEAGYLKRRRYRDKTTKEIKGMFWAYTDVPGEFNDYETIQLLEKNGFEIVNKNNEDIIQNSQSKNLHMENQVDTSLQTIDNKQNECDVELQNPHVENPHVDNQRLKILNNKNTNTLSDIKMSDHETTSNHLSTRSRMFLSVANFLADIVKSNKNIKINQHKLNSWSNDIRRLVETDGVDISRIKTVLEWYSKNIGGEFVPVVESGRALRDKFLRLEEAMERDTGTKKQKTQTEIEKEHFKKEIEFYQRRNGVYKDIGEVKETKKEVLDYIEEEKLPF